ncbi:MAG: NADH-quinone oxidoreductase subunit A [Armatimonadetes bacterium]|nr:NADH-quinone oxidoreductase subunit A [Armatimonadota bacterium]
MNPYLPILFMLIIATAFAVGALSLAMFIGRPKGGNERKLAPYECGIEPVVGEVRERFPVKFYLVAMLFILFDIEVIFLYPWAVVFRQLQVFGLIEMGIFLAILLLGYMYVWRVGALEWQ